MYWLMITTLNIKLICTYSSTHPLAISSKLMLLELFPDVPDDELDGPTDAA